MPIGYRHVVKTGTSHDIYMSISKSIAIRMKVHRHTHQMHAHQMDTHQMHTLTHQLS